MKITFSRTCISAATALTCAGGAPIAFGQTMEEMSVELKRLRDEINALKKLNIAAATPAI